MKLQVLAVVLTAAAEAYTMAATTTRVRRTTTTMCAQSVGERLKLECLDSLSRLGSRMSHVEISTIKDVQVLRVDEDFVEMQVVSCEEDRCVSLLVPLTLPVKCFVNDDGFDECIIQNIHELDKTSADEERFQKDRAETEAQTDAPTSAKFVVHSASSAVAKPWWWVEPPKYDVDLSNACLDTRAILNSKDFEHDLVAVAASLAKARVAAAKVDSVGPNGMLITALDADTRVALSLDLKFDQPCPDAVSLRRSVVGAVEFHGSSGN